MKIERLFFYCLMAGTFLFFSCSKADDIADTFLLEGMHPLRFTAIQNDVVTSPQTRVSDYDEGGNHKSKWSNGDKIEVKISGGNNDMETTCTLDESGSITAYNPQLYWKTTKGSTINAWYSNIAGQNTTSNTVSLADQSSGLAYVLKADEKNVNYNSGNIALNFKHQLAKVRIKVVKGTYAGTLNVTTVSIKGYTACNINKGTVTSVGNLGDIKTIENTYGSDTYYEANLVPGTDAMDKIITISADGKTTTCTLDAKIPLVAGRVYTCNVTVNAKLIIYPAEKTIPEITDDGKYIIKGNGTTTKNGIIISGSPTITLQNVSIDADFAIKIKKGTPTILINGNNHLVSREDCAISLVGENANVEIKGSGTNPTLTVTGKNFQAGIGGYYYGPFGNIYIEGITLTVYANQGAPGIGCIAYHRVKLTSGWIYIKNSTVTASGRVDPLFHIAPAAIGNCIVDSSAIFEQGDITIENTSKTKQQILSTLTSGSHKIGNGTINGTTSSNIKIGTITIIASDGTFTDNGQGYIDN